MRDVTEEKLLEAHLWVDFRRFGFDNPRSAIPTAPGGRLGALGLAGLLRPHSIRFVARLLFPLGALVCLGVAVL